MLLNKELLAIESATYIVSAQYSDNFSTAIELDKEPLVEILGRC